MSIAQLTMLYELSQPVYNDIIRPLVVEAVEDSVTEIDDIALSLCDVIFQHNGGQSQIEMLRDLGKKIYNSLLRDLLFKAAKRTETEIDDFILKLCDILFEYKEPELVAN